MNCPRCNTNLNVSQTQGIEIDYCPSCKGVWLDRGELEKIIERSNSFNASFSEHNDHYNDYNHDNNHDHHYDKHHDYGHYPKRRKGFLSDLFDF